MVAYLKQTGNTQGVRGNPLKKNAQVLIEASQIIVSRGEILWTSRRR